MSEKRFPRAPQLGPRPFDGPENPFAENPQHVVPYGADPFGGPATAEIQPFRPADYVATQPDRSRTLLMYGLGAAFFCGLSWLLELLVITGVGFTGQLVYAWPTALVSLALGIPAWVMGSADLRAIQAGAMSPEGRGRTRLGYWCGVVTTVLAAIPFFLIFGIA